MYWLLRHHDTESVCIERQQFLNKGIFKLDSGMQSLVEMFLPSLPSLSCLLQYQGTAMYWIWVCPPLSNPPFSSLLTCLCVDWDQYLLSSLIHSSEDSAIVYWNKEPGTYIHFLPAGVGFIHNELLICDGFVKFSYKGHGFCSLGCLLWLSPLEFCHGNPFVRGKESEWY